MGEGQCLGSLGNAYRSLGQFDKSITHHEQALVIAHEIGDRMGEGNALSGLGNAHSSLGQIDKALTHHKQALAIAREIGDRMGEGNALGSLGSAYRSLGQIDKAITHYKQSFIIAREIGDRRTEGNTLGNLGIAHLSLSPPDAAAACAHLRAAARVDDAIWHDLGRDDRARVTFAETDNVTLTPHYLQRAHALLGDPRTALEVAEGAKARSLAVLLAQQRIASSRAPAAGGDGGDDERAAATAGGTTADLNESLSFAALAATAVEQRACIVVYSILFGTQLSIWVLDSKGALAAFKDIPLKQAAARSITQLVEATRVSMEVDARGGGGGSAGGGRSVMSPDDDADVARPATEDEDAAACNSVAEPPPAEPPTTTKSAEEIAAHVEAAGDTELFRRVAATVRSTALDQAAVRRFRSGSACVTAIAEHAGAADDISGVPLARLASLFDQLWQPPPATDDDERGAVPVCTI